MRGEDLPEVVGPDEELDGLGLGVHGHRPVEGLHMPLLHLTHLRGGGGEGGRASKTLVLGAWNDATKRFKLDKVPQS